MTNQELALKIRRHVLQMTHDAKSSHVGSCLSIADIVAVLYGSVMKYKANEPKWEERDRFILSKGHACAAVYAALAENGFFSVEDLKGFYRNGSLLSGHMNHCVPGVEVSTGSLGYGLSIGCGMAMATKQKVFVLLGDGDLNEGSTWEAIMFAAHHKLDNLTAIIDYNKLQALGKTSDILDMESLYSKFLSFGWAVQERDGHDLKALESSFKGVPFVAGHPSCIICLTTKGKGVSWMEDDVSWHYKHPNDEELERALGELR